MNHQRAHADVFYKKATELIATIRFIIHTESVPRQAVRRGFPCRHAFSDSPWGFI